MTKLISFKLKTEHVVVIRCIYPYLEKVGVTDAGLDNALSLLPALEPSKEEIKKLHRTWNTYGGYIASKVKLPDKFHCNDYKIELSSQQMRDMVRLLSLVGGLVPGNTGALLLRRAGALVDTSDGDRIRASDPVEPQESW